MSALEQHVHKSGICIFWLLQTDFVGQSGTLCFHYSKLWSGMLPWPAVACCAKLCPTCWWHRLLGFQCSFQVEWHLILNSCFGTFQLSRLYSFSLPSFSPPLMKKRGQQFLSFWAVACMSEGTWMEWILQIRYALVVQSQLPKESFQPSQPLWL